MGAEAAKSVCRSCPVCAECLEFAMLSDQQAGLWGAATEEARRKLRRTVVDEFLRTLVR